MLTKKVPKSSKIYECKKCAYTTVRESQFERHLLTAKHQKLTSLTQKVPKSSKQSFICEYCEKQYKSRVGLWKHKQICDENINEYITTLENHPSKIQNESDTIIELIKQNQEFKELIIEQNKQLIELSQKPTTTNNNTINNNNINIHLNNFGEEDISHLTTQIMTALIKGPCKMIQNAIKFIHFNDSKPENKNICITNVKSKHIKVFKNNKWCYQNKHEAIENIIDKNYNILDDHYEYKGKEELTDFERERYREFQQFFDNQDKKLHSKIKDESELLLLNESIVDTKMIEDKKEL